MKNTDNKICVFYYMNKKNNFFIYDFNIFIKCPPKRTSFDIFYGQERSKNKNNKGIQLENTGMSENVEILEL